MKVKSIYRVTSLSLPAILTVALFVLTFFYVLLPSFTDSLINSKRKTTKELTTTGWQVVNSFYQLSQEGKMTTQQAQHLAMETLRNMKHGPLKKDYFWINDMTPVMLMHPYRPDLQGVNVENITDPKGKHIFKEFIKTSSEKGEGYVDYMWQWQDDKSTIVPKVSYIMYFKPWRWIIGTGIYIEDVKADIASITRRLKQIFVMIMIVLVAISIFIIWKNERNALIIESLNQNLEHKVKERTIELEASLIKLKEFQTKMVHVEKMSSLGQLAAGIAHEINNPVGFILSNMGMMKDYAATLKDVLALYEQLMTFIHEKKSAELHSLIEEINSTRKKEDISYIMDDLSPLLDESYDGIIRVRDIVQNLKNFARLDTNTAMEMADINEGIKSTLKIAHNELKYNCEVKMELGDIPLVECNLSQLNQVFMNLIVNASHAIKDHGEISIKTERDDEHVIVTISDTGCGIPKENISKLFDPFFTTKEVGKGTGLGLSIVHGIIEAHHATIDVESEVGQGTTFTIRIPINQEEDAKKDQQ